MKTVLTLGRQSFRPLSLFIASLALVLLFWPKLQRLWDEVNKGDPVLELLATLLVVVILALIVVVATHTRPIRQRT